MRPRHLIALLAALAAVVPAAALAGTPPDGGAVRLKVMTFNIEYGGTLVDFDKVVAAIRKADPDVVGVEEGETNIPRLAEALGYPYYNAGMHIVSRVPVLEPSGSDGLYALLEVRPGEVVALSNIHLPSDPYGPYWVRDGKPLAKILRLERRLRLSALARQLEVLPELAAQGMPVFLVGDFNAPSHLDWTQAAVGTRPFLTRAVPWPVSLAVEAAGFRDSYREVHPDPVADPGLTWWAARPAVVDWAGNPTADVDPRDRIDFVYASGPAIAVDSVLVGEKGAKGVAFSVSPWPSDHRAVMSTFDVTPAPMPTLVASDTLLATAGPDVHVRFHTAGAAAASVELVPEGGAPGAAVVASRPTGGASDGTVTFPTAGLAQGGYDALLLSGDGQVLARTTFWVRAEGARASLSTSAPRYRVGQPIEVSWANAPANRWDWIGVYRAPGDPAKDSYLIWQYTGGAMSGTTHGKPAGTIALDGPGTYGKPWPLPPGTYDVFYLISDTYRAVARARFTVVR